MTKQEKKKLDKYVRKLTELYEQALNSDYIRKPLAWALYYTWRECNNTEPEIEEKFEPVYGKMVE